MDLNRHLIKIVSLCVTFALCAGQNFPTLQTGSLQTCASNLACNLNFSDAFQTKLDNLSHYMELEMTLMRYQVNNEIQPLQKKLDLVEQNCSAKTDSLTTALKLAQVDVFLDRNALNNLTKAFFDLNGEFHKENSQRSQDINSVMVELNNAKKQIAALQSKVNALVTNGNISMTNVATQNTGSTKYQSCADKDKEIAALQNNLTYYMNAYTGSQKDLENVRTLENLLQSKVIALTANLSTVESANAIKDKVIVNLQQQLKTLQNNPSVVTAPGSCSGELGMRDGQIPSSAITASESQPGHEAENARLDNQQGWYTADKEHSHDYLQIDTGYMHYITKIATQGAPCCDVMVTNYTLQYSNDGQTWKEYKQNCDKVFFSGNIDTNTVVEHTLPEPIVGRFVRFYVEDFRKAGQSNYVGMRTELYGCSASTGK